MDILVIKRGTSETKIVLAYSDGKAITHVKSGLEKGFIKTFRNHLQRTREEIALSVLISLNHNSFTPEYVEWLGEFLYWIIAINPEWLPDQSEIEVTEIIDISSAHQPVEEVKVLKPITNDDYCKLVEEASKFDYIIEGEFEDMGCPTKPTKEDKVNFPP